MRGGVIATSPELATDAPARIYEGRWSQEADGAVRVADVGVVCGRADVRSGLTGSWSRRRQGLRKHCGLPPVSFIVTHVHRACGVAAAAQLQSR